MGEQRTDRDLSHRLNTNIIIDSILIFILPTFENTTKTHDYCPFIFLYNLPNEIILNHLSFQILTFTVTQSENGKVSAHRIYDKTTRIHPHVPKPSSVFLISSNFKTQFHLQILLLSISKTFITSILSRYGWCSRYDEKRKTTTTK